MTKSAAAFKRTTALTLPSGLEVEVRKPSIKALVLHSPKGTVPEFLTKIVLNGLNGNVENPLENIGDKPADEQLAMLAGLDAFTELVVKAALVWPKITVNPDYDNGEIAYADLDDADTNFLSAWGMPKDVQVAETFSQGTSASLEPTPNLPSVPPATE